MRFEASGACSGNAGDWLGLGTGYTMHLSPRFGKLQQTVHEGKDPAFSGLCELSIRTVVIRRFGSRIPSGIIVTTWNTVEMWVPVWFSRDSLEVVEVLSVVRLN